ncbi:MAG: cytochrome c-type biogenesis protein CcmH [Myxococcales bacterium]|nr:cytochrome c-type biogenesis protein CcmH [Myxococcales bacterium]
MILLLELGVALAQPTAAATPAPAGQAAAAGAQEYLIPGLPPGPPPPADQVQQLAYEIGVAMRCPVCQGMSVADSTSPAAVNMQNRIRELVGAGYSREQIEDSFVESYGEWVLLEPKFNSPLSSVIWVGPWLVVGLGAALAWSTVVQWRKEEDDVPLPSDTGLAPKDRYEERLLAELED